MKKFSFNNGDLQNNIEKIMTYSSLEVYKDRYDDLNLPFTIEVNDNSYFYANILERNQDYLLLRKKLKERV